MIPQITIWYIIYIFGKLSVAARQCSPNVMDEQIDVDENELHVTLGTITTVFTWGPAIGQSLVSQL